MNIQQIVHLIVDEGNFFEPKKKRLEEFKMELTKESVLNLFLMVVYEKV